MRNRPRTTNAGAADRIEIQTGNWDFARSGAYGKGCVGMETCQMHATNVAYHFDLRWSGTPLVGQAAAEAT
jgi:hypothetical protein